MRRLRIPTLLAALALIGCGPKYQLPTEHPGAAVVPTDKSYALLAIWSVPNAQDILVTQGTGSQLFILKNWGGTGAPTTARGDVQLYPFAQPVPINAPAYFEPPHGLFNPVALAWGQNRLFVLDAGDTCMAKYDPARGTCEAFVGRDTSLQYANIIRDYSATWRVREYASKGGDTISTFTDTTFAKVSGIAADDQGFVYVCGWAAVLDTNANDQRIRDRKFKSRIIRYARGPRYPGVNPPDLYMPGADWHRDTTWRAIDGTGLSFIQDPAKMTWTTLDGGALFVADRGNDAAKLMATFAPNIGFLKVDGSETPTGTAFHSPEGVAVDRQGYLYVVDRLNARVLRYDAFGNYVQDVNVENNMNDPNKPPLLDPIAVGVDDSLAYVIDRGRGQVLRYKRRP